jgi:hypothetical protein
MLAIPSDSGPLSKPAPSQPISTLASSATSAFEPSASEKRSAKHSGWDLSPGAYATLSTPEKRKVRNRFASTASSKRKKNKQRLFKDKVSCAFSSSILLESFGEIPVPSDAYLV